MGACVLIFAKGYIEQICSGEKTQTRRPNRGHYKIRNSYSIQPCRTCKGIKGYRVVMDSIEKEDHRIYTNDAMAEGGYSPDEFETLFRSLYPKWDGVCRYVFKFHVVKQNDLK